MTGIKDCLWICVTVMLLIRASSVIGNDTLKEINANGSAIVLQAIGTLQQSGVFQNDNELLRRISYVETLDGKRLTNSSTDGGIWAVKENKFLQIQHLKNHAQLSHKFQQIQNAFGINWTSVQWKDLCIPLHSMIAARLVLYLASHEIPPANDLEAQARFWVQYYNLDGDVNDFIGAASALQGGVLDNSANEFFLGFSLNFDGKDVLLQLFVTTVEPTPVKFTLTATGFSYSGTVTQNSSTQVTLPSSLQVRNANERNKGIYVKAEGDRKIAIYGLNYKRGTTDAFLALPCNRLPIDEYEYSYPNPAFNVQSAVLIIGCEDNTVVNTGKLTFVINRLQTYLTLNTNSDILTGRITANKPITVFSNHECASIPFGVAGCDHLTEQIPPTLTWGKNFLVASLLGRRSGELFRIVTEQSPTNVTVNCITNAKITQPFSYLLTAVANWQEFEIRPDSLCSITSTAPILVAQFALGRSRDTAIGHGDPFMMLIPPMEQFNTNNYVFNSPPMFELNCLTVYVEPKYFRPERIFVDEVNLNNVRWSQIRGCSSTHNVCGYITRVNLETTGDHRLYHLDQHTRLGVSVYGFVYGNSYGYSGGMKLTPLQLAIVSFLSATYQYDEGIGGVQITITHSGNGDTPTVVLVASNNVQIITCGGSIPAASPVLEFQPGEREKQITIMFSKIPRIELYLSAGEGVYLSPFPRTEIMNLNPDNGQQTGEARMCIDLKSSCHCSTADPPVNVSRSLCSWCIATGIVVFTVVAVGVIIVTLLVIKLYYVSKTKKQKKKVKMETEYEAYVNTEHSDQGPKVDDPVYEEIDIIHD